MYVCTTIPTQHDNAILTSNGSLMDTFHIQEAHSQNISKIQNLKLLSAAICLAHYSNSHSSFRGCVLTNKLDWELVKSDKGTYSTAATRIISVRARDTRVPIYMTQSNIHLVDTRQWKYRVEFQTCNYMNSSQMSLTQLQAVSDANEIQDSKRTHKVTQRHVSATIVIEE
jgi:hypothetical protein